MLFPWKVSHSLLTLERLVRVEYSNSPLVQVKSIGHVWNFHYFAIIPLRSTCTMWTKYPGAKFMGTAFKNGSSTRNENVNFSKKPWIWSFHVVVWLMTARKCAKTYNARERLFLLIKLILWRSRCRRRRRRRRRRRSANENVTILKKWNHVLSNVVAIIPICRGSCWSWIIA